MTADQEALKRKAESVLRIRHGEHTLANGVLSLLAKLEAEEERAEFWNTECIKEQGKALDLKAERDQLEEERKHWKLWCIDREAEVGRLQTELETAETVASQRLKRWNDCSDVARVLEDENLKLKAECHQLDEDLRSLPDVQAELDKLKEDYSLTLRVAAEFRKAAHDLEDERDNLKDIVVACMEEILYGSSVYPHREKTLNLLSRIREALWGEQND